MSWIVENTLHRCEYIKNNCELDSDSYLDLISIQGAIKQLNDAGKFSEKERIILDLVVEGYYQADIIRITGFSKDAVRMNFKTACDKIAEKLGGYYTQEGYEEYITDKYGLSSDQIENMQSFLSGRFRHK